VRRQKWKTPVATLVRAWSELWRCRLCFPAFGMQLPEEFPKVFLQRMQIRIPRHDASEKLPVAGALDESSANGILQHVKAHLRKDSTPAHVLAKDSIAGLMLEFIRREDWIQIFTKKLHWVELVALSAQPHPDEMCVIRHQAVRWAIQALSNTGVQNQLAEFLMEQFVQPAVRPFFKGLGPMHDCVTLIKMPFQTRQMILMPFGIHAGLILCGWDAGKPVATLVRAWAEFGRFAFWVMNPAHALTSVATSE
jgi:hypothetical protein